MKKYPETVFRGEDKLRCLLEGIGFRCATNHLRNKENMCNWYAYRRSVINARRCECNEDKPGMQIVIKPCAMTINDVVHRSVEVELSGEAAGVWWNLSAYGIHPENVNSKLADIETSLISAWNSLVVSR